MAVQEHHLVKVDTAESAGGFTWLLEAAPGVRQGGTGFLVKNSFLPFVTIMKEANPGLSWLRIRSPSGKRDIVVGSAYAPQGRSKDSEARKAFFERLSEVVAGEQGSADVMVLGDFNSPSGNHERLGTVGRETKSGDQYELIRLVDERRLTSAWVAAHQSAICPETRQAHQAGGEGNVLDHILLSSRLVGQVVTAGVVNRGYLGSDHNPIYAALSGFSGMAQRKDPVRVAWKTERFDEKEVRDQYFESLEEKLGALLEGGRSRQQGQKVSIESGFYIDTLGARGPPRKTRQIKHSENRGSEGRSVDDLFELTVAAFEAANREVLGTKRIKKGRSAKWFTNEIKQELQAAQEDYIRHRKLCKDADALPEEVEQAAENLRYSRNRARSKVSKAKKKSFNLFIKSLENGSKKDFWRKVKAGKPSQGQAIRDDEGTLQTEPGAIAEAFAEHYQRLGEESQDDKFDDEWKRKVEEEVRMYPKDPETAAEKEVTECLDANFTIEEIWEVCKEMKTGAAGKDGVTGLMAKIASGCLEKRVDSDGRPIHSSSFIRVVRELGNRSLREHVFPSAAKEGRIFNIFKEGSTEDRGNYRGITLLSVIGKILTRAIANRLQAQAEQRQWLADGQGGFRKNRRTEDNALVLLRLLEKRRHAKEGKGTYVFFLDVQKAYDTVWRKGLLYKLHKLGIRGKMYKLLAALYTDTTSSVISESGVESRVFKISEGVRQGDPLSCILFNLFFNDLVEAIDGAEVSAKKKVRSRNSHGIAATRVSSLLFADDVSALATSRGGLAKILAKVEEHSFRWRWRPNVKKSQWMRVPCLGEKKRDRSGDEPQLKLWGRELEECESYKYLGITFTSSLGWNAHVDRICGKATGRAGICKRWMSQHKLSRKLKRLQYVSQVRPLLEYASSVWSPNSGMAKKLEATQNKCLRILLGVKATTPVAGMRFELGIPSLASRRRKLLMRYWMSMKGQRTPGHRPRLAVDVFFWKNMEKIQGNAPAGRHRTCLSEDDFELIGMDKRRARRMLQEEGEEAFLSYLQESINAADVKEAAKAMESLLAKGSVCALEASAQEAQWGPGRWLMGSEYGALLKFRARLNVLLSGVEFVDRIAVPVPCPMCQVHEEGEKAQEHLLATCKDPEMVALRVICSVGPFRGLQGKELYFSLLANAFLLSEAGSISEKEAYEREKIAAAYIEDCWSARRRRLNKISAEGGLPAPDGRSRTATAPPPDPTQDYDITTSLRAARTLNPSGGSSQ